MSTATISIIANVTSDGDVELPPEAREILREAGIKQIAIMRGRTGRISLVALPMTLADVKGSATPVKGASLDLEAEIAAARNEYILEKYG